VRCCWLSSMCARAAHPMAPSCCLLRDFPSAGHQVSATSCWSAGLCQQRSLDRVQTGGVQPVPGNHGSDKTQRYLQCVRLPATAHQAGSSGRARAAVSGSSSSRQWQAVKEEGQSVGFVVFRLPWQTAVDVDRMLGVVLHVVGSTVPLAVCLSLGKPLKLIGCAFLKCVGNQLQYEHGLC